MATKKTTEAIPTILLYQRTFCEELALLLEDKGFRVICTNEGNVEDRIRLEPYDIAVLDCMSDEDPLSALRCLRGFDDSKPVIMLMGSYDSCHVQNAYLTGADECILRYRSWFNELTLRIRAVLRRSGWQAKPKASRQ